MDQSNAPLHYPLVSKVVREQLEQLEQDEQQATLDKDIANIHTQLYKEYVEAEAN